MFPYDIPPPPPHENLITKYTVYLFYVLWPFGKPHTIVISKITNFYFLGGHNAPFESTWGKPMAECDPSKELGDAAQSSSSKTLVFKKCFLAIGNEGSLVRGRLGGLRDTSNFYIWSCQNPEIAGGMSWYLIRKLISFGN